jgi:sulfate permease, SulP family
MAKEMSGTTDSFTPKLLTVLREGYTADDFRADALAGLTVAIVALPLSMALAIASGLSPDKGLFAAIIGGFLISALGGSRFQIGGPAGAFIVLISAVLGRHGYNGLILATFMAGLMMILLGWLRLGNLIRYIPQTVLVGFAAGIAIIIFASQIKELLGLELVSEPKGLFQKLRAIGQSISQARPMTMALSALALAIILWQRRYRPSWPGMLFAVVITAALTAFFNFDVATIGTKFGGIPHGLPTPVLPVFSTTHMLAVLPDALAIALLGGIESLLSAAVADSLSGDRHRSNGELVAQGLANMATASFGGMCVTGTLARTATNIKAGARSPVSGMLHSLYLLGLMLLAAPLATYVPLAALAAVLTIVCWNMVEKQEFRHFLKESWKTAAILLATFLLTVFVDLIVGIVAGTILSLVVNRGLAADVPSHGPSP